MDLSGISDEELRRIAGITPQQPDLSQMSDEELMQAAGIQAKPAPAPQSPGFLSRVGDKIDNRWAEGQQAAADFAEGKITTPELVLASTGKVVAGSINDAVGEGLVSAYRSLPLAVQEGVAATGRKIADTSIGQAVLRGAQKVAGAYQEFAQENPRAARNLESVANIGIALPVSQGANATKNVAANPTGSALTNIGKAVVTKADDVAKARKAGFVQELVTPKLTPKVRSELFSNSTEKGILRSRVVNPTPAEKAVIDAVAELPVKKSNSLLKNYNLIDASIQTEASKLASDLAKSNVKVPLGRLNQALDSSMSKLKANPFITGDAETAAQRVIDGFKQIVIKNNDLSASGLLKARKEFDSWVKSQKGAGIFDPLRDSPVSTAVQNVRQTINDLVAQSVPSAQVKKSLAKQSNLYRALDAIETKGGYEAPNMLKRAADKVVESVPGKSAITKAGLTAAGLGSAAMAPVAAGAALGLYGAGKLANSPTVWRGAGKAMSGAGRAVKAVGGDVPAFSLPGVLNTAIPNAINAGRVGLQDYTEEDIRRLMQMTPADARKLMKQ